MAPPYRRTKSRGGDFPSLNLEPPEIMRIRTTLVVAAILLSPTPALAQDGEAPPPLNMQSGILVEADSGKVLWSKEAEQPRPPASLAKILTGLIILERVDLDERVVITDDMLAVDGTKTGVQPGWRVTVRDLLW